MVQIALESREFLALLFADLRDDLANQDSAKGPGHSGAEVIARKRATYDALLDGLADGGQMPDDEAMREYVVGLAKATDEANQYEQAVLEHRAFEELALALGATSSTESGAAVDWDGLLASLLHPTQFQIIEAMHWIDQPVSASQLVHVFDRNPRDLPAVSYHLRRLSELKVVRLSKVTTTRGAQERFYKLVVIDKQWP